MKRPLTLWLLVISLVFIGLGGLYGGTSLVVDPTGDLLGVGDVRHMLPVADFLLPGLFLFVVMGLVPLLLTYALLARPDWPWLVSLTRWSHYHWAWTGTIVFGTVLALWLVFQAFIIGFASTIQYTTALVGVLIFLFALWPTVRLQYAARD